MLINIHNMYALKFPAKSIFELILPEILHSWNIVFIKKTLNLNRIILNRKPVLISSLSFTRLHFYSGLFLLGFISTRLHLVFCAKVEYQSHLAAALAFEPFPFPVESFPVGAHGCHVDFPLTGM